MSIKRTIHSFLIIVSEKIGLTFSDAPKNKNNKSICHYFFISLIFLLPHTAHAADPYQVAKALVTTQTCTNGETVDELLDHKIRPSRRDLGWRVFEDDDGYIVERAFLVSKSMEIRYRWHVDGHGAIFATNSRTENLCS